jgi:hypothetical protein
MLLFVFSRMMLEVIKPTKTCSFSLKVARKAVKALVDPS